MKVNKNDSPMVTVDGTSDLNVTNRMLNICASVLFIYIVTFFYSVLGDNAKMIKGIEIVTCGFVFWNKTALPSPVQNSSRLQSFRSSLHLLSSTSHHHHLATNHIIEINRNGRETKERNRKRFFRLCCCLASRCSSHCLTSSMQSSYMYISMRHRSFSSSTALEKDFSPITFSTNLT